MGAGVGKPCECSARTGRRACACVVDATTGELRSGEDRTLLEAAEALNEPVHLLAIAKDALPFCCTDGSHPERPSWA